MLTCNKADCQTLTEPLSFLSRAWKAALPCVRAVAAKVSHIYGGVRCLPEAAEP